MTSPEADERFVAGKRHQVPTLVTAHTNRQLEKKLAARPPAVVFVEDCVTGLKKRDELAGPDFGPLVTSGATIAQSYPFETMDPDGQSAKAVYHLYALSDETCRIEAYPLQLRLLTQCRWNAEMEWLLGYPDIEIGAHVVARPAASRRDHSDLLHD